MLHELSSIVFFWTFSVEMEKKKAYFSSHGQCLLKLEEKGNFFHLKSNFFLWCSCLASFSANICLVQAYTNAYEGISIPSDEVGAMFWQLISTEDSNNGTN